MEIKSSAFGIAVGIVVAAAFTICSLFVAVAPEATAEFIGYLLHINLAGLTRSISWAELLRWRCRARYLDWAVGPQLRRRSTTVWFQSRSLECLRKSRKLPVIR